MHFERGPLISQRSSKASTTNAIVCVSWNERLFGRSKCGPSRDARRTTCLRIKMLRSTEPVFSFRGLSQFRLADKLAIDPFESKTPSAASNTLSGNLYNRRRSREISKNQPRSRRSRKIPKPRSDMINVRFIVMYRWKIWNVGIRKEGGGGGGMDGDRRSASVSNSTTRRTRSLIDIVYRFDRSPRPPAGIDHAAFHGGEIRKGV